MGTQYITSTKPADAYQGRALPTKELRRLIRSAAQAEKISDEQAEATWIRIITEIERNQADRNRTAQ